MQTNNENSEFSTTGAWIGLLAYLILILIIAIPFII